MQYEIFGPILPVKSYQKMVTVNDVIYHAAQEDVPFGSIGPSGMSSYHAKEGFLEFSHPEAVFKQMNSELVAMARPPYGKTFQKQILGRIKIEVKLNN